MFMIHLLIMKMWIYFFVTQLHFISLTFWLLIYFLNIVTAIENYFSLFIFKTHCIFILCLYILIRCMYVCALHIYLIPRGQKSSWDPSELERQMFWNHHVDTGNQSPVCYSSSQYSYCEPILIIVSQYSLSNLSRTPSFLYIILYPEN